MRSRLEEKSVWAHHDARASPCEAIFRSLVAPAVSGLLPILIKHHVANHDHWECVDGEEWRPIPNKIPGLTAGEATAKYADLDRQVALRRKALEDRHKELLDAQARELWKNG